jgi:serine/threonine protein kinase
MYTKGDQPVPGFRLVRRLGKGGFGEVWKASAPGGTDAALKFISLGNKQGFKEFRAIRLVKEIRHPNLVPIHAFWLKDEYGNFFEDNLSGDSSFSRAHAAAELIISMGLGSKNLLDRLQECKDLGLPGIPPEELLGYMKDAAKAIDYLNEPCHDMGKGAVAIQHSDIKPQNIIIVGGAAQVCDFGLARVLEDVRISSTTGTIAYMPPELLTENLPSPTSDQYSLAISYIELRTGALPFDITSPVGPIRAISTGNLDFSKLPEAEVPILQRATAFDPAARYGSCTEMVKALRRAHNALSTSSTELEILRKSQVSPPLAGSDSNKRHTFAAGGSNQLLQKGLEIVPGYKIVRLLGRGGYGEVWEATAPGGRKVAIKVIRDLEDTSSKLEFRALKLIKGVENHHLMELYGFWLLDEAGAVIPDAVRDQADAPRPKTLVIASKLADKNLLDRFRECKKAGLTGIPVPELLGYLKQAAKALDYLNAPQHPLDGRLVAIQHRDIKPENILLCGSTVKIGDFGLAKLVEGTSAVVHDTSRGFTPGYMAPEMIANAITRWTDQYALAVTYYKLRTGEMPFPPKTSQYEIMMRHAEGRLDLDQLPTAERAVIARGTARKPEERFPDCATLIKALEKAWSSPTASPKTVVASPPTAAGRAGGNRPGTPPASGGSDPLRLRGAPEKRAGAVTALGPPVPGERPQAQKSTDLDLRDTEKNPVGAARAPARPALPSRSAPRWWESHATQPQADLPRYYRFWPIALVSIGVLVGIGYWCLR